MDSQEAARLALQSAARQDTPSNFLLEKWSDFKQERGRFCGVKQNSVYITWARGEPLPPASD
jgi:hypothetical protein